MKRVENEIRRRADRGEVIDYQVYPLYKGDDLIPHAITIRAVGDDGLDFGATIINQPNLGPGPDYGF